MLCFELPNKKLFFTPLSDLVFRSIFGAEGSEHITKAFLESVLKIKLEEFNYINSEFLIKRIKDKKQIADIKAVCKNSNDKILVEMQYRAVDDINNRFTSYAEKIHLEELQKNMTYTKLPKVIMVIIMGENLPELKGKKGYISEFNDRDKDKPECIFSECVTKFVIELPKYIQMKNESSVQDREKIINPWLEFLINPLGREVQDAMRNVKELREAVDKLRELNADDEVREIYEAEQFDRYFREAERASAEEKGKKRGKAEGKTEAESAIIINMFKNNIPIEDITKMTNIEIEKVRKIIELYQLEAI